VCRRELGPYNDQALCRICIHRIKPNSPPFCLQCGRSLESRDFAYRYCPDCRHTVYHFDRAWAVGAYDGILKDCIHQFKFKGRVDLLPIFTELFENFMDSYMNMEEFDAIVPVPLDSAKKRERTFNQAEILAKAVSELGGVDLITNNLLKTRRTHPQSKLSGRERRESLKNAFSVVEPSLFKDRNILLVDDVFTTGSTLNECTKLVLSKQVRGVSCLVLARG